MGSNVLQQGKDAPPKVNPHKGRKGSHTIDKGKRPKKSGKQPGENPYKLRLVSCTSVAKANHT